MRIHLVPPRTGSGNAGPPRCLQCGATVFNPDGRLAYDPGVYAHTTDPPTYSGAAFAPDPSPFTPCIQGTDDD